MKELFKLGHDDENLEVVEHFHADTFLEQNLKSRSRLLIAPSGRHIDLMLWLLKEMVGPFFILVVLRVARDDDLPAGRYASSELIDFAQAEAFLIKFRDFLERDGRQDIWVSSENGDEMVIYDRHNYLYSYGPLDDLKSTILNLGFVEGESPLSVPHSHHYHAEFDEDLKTMLSEYPWSWSPLRPEDEA